MPTRSKSRTGEHDSSENSGISALAHERAHVDPGQVRPLDCDVRKIVQEGVQDRNGLIRLADLIGVRIDQHRPVACSDVVKRPPLAIDVAGRALDAAQERLYTGPQIGPGHCAPTPS